MKAMILAAGLGTRLGALTRERPKALAEVAGQTLLEITLGRLRQFGIDEVIINVHHHPDMVVEYLRAHHDFGMRITISREEQLLDTGGGLKNAAHFFLRDGDPQDGEPPFVLHNVDVLSSIDLGEMVRLHRARHALATLATQQRESSRYLLFDEQLTLCGRRAGAEMEMIRRAASVQELAFTGIHVISPRIFELMESESMESGKLMAGAASGSAGSEPQAFPIIPQYLRMAAAGETIVAYRADASYWRDLGTPASLQHATEDVAQKLIALPAR